MLGENAWCHSFNGLGNQIADVLATCMLSHGSKYAILIELYDHSVGIAATIGNSLAFVKSTGLQLCQSGLLLLYAEAILILEDVLGAGCSTFVRDSGLV